MRKRLKTLLVITDLYKNCGGGQTVYRRLIEASPEIDFFYFRSAESDGTGRPPNAFTLPLLRRRKLRPSSQPPFIPHAVEAYRDADQIALSAAGHSFDIVDVPDFVIFGGALKKAFEHRGVKVGRLMLAMHGNISITQEMNWGSASDRLHDIRDLEQWQFNASDGVYSISPRYIRSWQAIIRRDIHYIDPAHFVVGAAPTAPWQPSKSRRPSLYCIGRSERRKGNDLFVELVRWLDPASFDHAAHVGEQDFSVAAGSAHILQNIARARGFDVEHQGPRDRKGLLELFAAPSIVVLPSRFDSFNLTALDTLFSGCPLAVSSAAGVCDYLDKMHPHLPYVKLDLGNFYSAVPMIRDTIEQYDERRDKLHAAIAQHPPFPTEPLNIAAVYESVLAVPPREADWRFEPLQLDYTASATLRGRFTNRHAVVAPAPAKESGLWQFLKGLRRFAIEMALPYECLRDAKYSAATIDSLRLRGRLGIVSRHGEQSEQILKEKLRAIYRYASNPLFRCNFWLDIARLERVRGNELMAVTYELRVLRQLGDGQGELLPRVIDSLQRHGFVREAEAAKAMFGNRAGSKDVVYTFLTAAYNRLRSYQAKPFEIVDDRRFGNPRVAVIVSLYKAADKLAFFLTAIAQQTMVRQGSVEFVLVDSGSPTDERKVFDAFQQATPLNVVYARSSERETIQAAWNRGIALARASYLVFLGVDETLYPETLDVLAKELDENLEVDWVMANSLVTAVDAGGLYKSDIMLYDRSGAGKDHVYLETCYLSWVGGMYRKSVHDRFGYYDETFGAAGDTEFKNRILPYIKVKFIDRMLGLFLNYPDGQTSASPRAEIEDLRAWYMHRTPGGVRYAFENRPIGDAEKLLQLTLGYRKSYCRHISSDIEYGHYLARYIKERKPDSAVANCVDIGLAEMLQTLRGFELTPHMPTRLGPFARMLDAGRVAARWQTAHRRSFGSSANPSYQLFNDNRYEQHSWLWKSV